MLPLFIGLFVILLLIILLGKLQSLNNTNIGWHGLVFLAIIVVSVLSVKKTESFVGAPVDYAL